MRVGVAGIARSGSSMMMAMLAAGGVPPVAGSQPRSYELATLADIVTRAPTTPDGAAIKLLETLGHEPALELGAHWKFLLMARNPREQARSHLKLLIHQGYLPVSAATAANRRYLARGIRHDQPLLERAYRRVGPVCLLNYDYVVIDPDRTAARIARFLGPELVLDVDAMAHVVHVRSPKCAPDLHFERTGRPGRE